MLNYVSVRGMRRLGKLGQLIEDASEHKNKLAMRQMSLLRILLGLIKVTRILYRPLRTSVFLNII